MSIEQTAMIRGGYIVLVPEEKSPSHTRVAIERRQTIDINDPEILHRGQGNHLDLIIYKSSARLSNDERSPPSSPAGHTRQFHVSLIDQQSKEIHEEIRTLSFYFQSANESLRHTDEFIHSLFQGATFPRDYFSFIKRLMELLRRFPRIETIRLDIQKVVQGEDQQSEESEHVEADRPEIPADIKERLLDFLEQAFPNSIGTNDLTKFLESDEQTVREYLIELEEKNLVKSFAEQDEWIRVIITAEEEKTHQVILYKSVKELKRSIQPTIAILTMNYFEKLAVDTMIEEKITFLRQRAGESNVYTIGRIGNQQVVSTKLPLIGRTRTAQISIGSATTRLLGTFQDVEHVFIVGCAGAIPHYNDANEHLRRGDIVVGYPNEEDYVYGIYEAEPSDEGYEFISTCYKPKSFQLYHLLDELKRNYEQTSRSRAVTHRYPWETFLEEGIQQLLSHHIDCLPPVTDRLFRETVEVEHPQHSMRDHLKPTIHFGMLGGGKNVLADDYFKQTLRDKCGVLSFDAEIDQVLAAIQGNRIESFVIVRGIADYHDGSGSKEWQPFAALCAAALMKTLIYQIPSTKNVEAML